MAREAADALGAAALEMRSAVGGVAHVRRVQQLYKRSLKVRPGARAATPHDSAPLQHGAVTSKAAMHLLLGSCRVPPRTSVGFGCVPCSKAPSVH